jgi:iron complex transport system substrate-binding protein
LPRTPRRLLSGLLALAAAATVSACANDDGGGGEEQPDAEGWEFTDDLGNTVELAETPTRIAGLNDVLSSLWNYGIEPVAGWGQTSIEDDIAFEGKDLSDVAVVGTSYGQIDLEALAAADPDIIVASVYPTDAEGTLPGTMYGFESVEQQEQVAEIAPIVGIVWGGSAADVIERTAELAESLGVDFGSGEPAEMKEDFEEASATLTEAAAGGVSVLPVFATEADGWWMAKAPDDPSLHLYQDLGVDFVDPGGDDYFWNSVGWEEVTSYPSDVLLYSLRFSMSPEEIAAQPTAALLPAVQAEQLYPWKYLGMDYQAQARYMEELAGWLNEADKVS